MRIVCVSDTHTHHRRFSVPKGDVLIHAGDLTSVGRIEQASACLQWLSEQPHKHKIVIAGNHDWCFLREKAAMVSACHDLGLTYLEDSGISADGLKIWGSPYTPQFAGWAFMQSRGADMRRHWDLIPANLDVLITHGPPHGILDRTQSGEHAGCEELKLVIEKQKPRLHVFGHIHEALGVANADGTVCVNAATAAAVVDLDDSKLTLVGWMR